MHEREQNYDDRGNAPRNERRRSRNCYRDKTREQPTGSNDGPLGCPQQTPKTNFTIETLGIEPCLAQTLSAIQCARHFETPLFF